MTDTPPGFHLSARMRLTLSYAGFLVVAGTIILIGVALVLRYGPDYPLTPRDPRIEGTLPETKEVALLRVSILILFCLAVIGLVGGWILAGHVLRPLQRINEAAAIAATGRLDHRVNLAGRHDEFGELATTFDHMLARLHDAFQSQERFAANASHELRSPLAVMATMLDVARANPDAQDYAVLLERLQHTNSRAIGLTDALLRLADANAINAAFERADLAAIAQRAVVEHATEAGRSGIAFSASLNPAPVVGDVALLEQLASNVVLNAIRHNIPDGDAVVTTGRDRRTGRAWIRVENPGRPYTVEEAERLTEPFLRGEGRIRRQGKSTGHGLGLAIVQRIATVHDGALQIVPRPGGGLIVSASFPPPPGAYLGEAIPDAPRRDASDRSPLPDRG